MKKNKGFSLFEMLVAIAVLAIVMSEVASILSSSQKLYSNGVYEVQLQENAQQVVQLVQDLLCEATTDIPVPEDKQTDPDHPDESDPDHILSQIITIKTEERHPDGSGGYTTAIDKVVYRIGRGDDLGVADNVVHGDHSLGTDYTTLYLIKTINDVDSDPIPIAENVRGIKLQVVDYDYDGTPTPTLPNFETADLLTLSVKMRGEKYSYSMSSEVYLRNQPGTKPQFKDLPPVPTGSDVTINVLRYKTYDLCEYVPDGYEYFEWADESADKGTKYSLTGDGKHNLATSGLNSSWSSVGSGLIFASQTDGDFSDPIKISIHTDAVNNGVSMPLVVYDNCSDKCVSVLPVTGLYVGGYTEAKFEAQITMQELPKGVMVHNEGGEHTFSDFDICLFGDRNGFKKPNDGNYTEYEKFGPFDNSTFAKFDGNTIDLTQLKVSVCFYKRIAGQPGGYGSNADLNANYNVLSNGNKVAFLDNQAYPKYTFGKETSGSVNAFTFTTTSDINNPYTYWDNVVDEDAGDGYIRVQCNIKYPGGQMFTAYMYYYPQLSGSPDQKATLQGHMY
jgi:prepilin-type N-terminal cleavage/methylation domain-containing protein